jgi:hypothetical protein
MSPPSPTSRRPRSDRRRPLHEAETPSVLIDSKSRPFADSTADAAAGDTEVERDYVDTVRANWSSIKTYFR